LTEIWRQKETWQKEATVQLATARTREAITQYSNHEFVHEYDSQLQAKQSLVDQWNDDRISQPNKTQIILAYRRDDVRELNEMARMLKKTIGELGPDHSIKTARGERQLADGERIYFLKNDRDLGVK